MHATNDPAARRLRNWSIVWIVLAVCVTFLFPVTAKGGTETTRDRIVTAIVCLLFAATTRLQRGGSMTPGRVMLQLAAPLVLVLPLTVLGFLHAGWIIPLALFTCAHALIAPAVSRIWHRVFPAEPAHEHEETTTDVIESIATAFVLALIVREFAFEAFKIPTGSMYPTIKGDGDRRKGDRLLAAKAPLLFGDPQRWSIVVFKYPLFRPTNYIKRLVGLPGEHVEIRAGDIYVNGSCVAKPDEVQETLWDAQQYDRPDKWSSGGMGTAFTPEGSAKWNFTGDAEVTGSAETGHTGWIVDDSGAPDLRVSMDVDPRGLEGGANPGSIRIRIDGDGRRVELEASRDAMWLTAPGGEGTEGDGRRKLDVPGLGSGTSRLSFSVADRMVRIARDGALVAKIPTEDKTNLESRADRLWIGVSDGTARFSNVSVQYDLQYTSPGQWDVPQGCYFMLGDNSGSSNDSRKWEGRVFHLKDGTTLVADENVRLDDERSVQNIRTLPGGGWEFHDSYGVVRRVREADLAEKVQTSKLPFVRREDLVGRAFLIFFPFPPFGDWRPRLLP